MIPVFGSAVGEEELAELAESVQAQWLGFGPKVARFEAEFAKRLGLGEFVMVDSGSNALFLAVSLLDLPHGSEIVLPALTWVACAHAVRLAGHHPVFCDVEPDTANASAATIAPWLGPRTAAVMVVHYAGHPVDLEPIAAFGLPVIEDAAHAVDSRYRGAACGSVGDVGIYSFDAVKNLTAGTGGGLTCRDPALAERARRLRYCGTGGSGFEAAAGSERRWWEHDAAEPFIKMLPTDLSAGIALAQLAKLDAHQARRRVQWARYDAALGALPWVERPPATAAARDRHSWFTYLVRVPERDRLARYLLERGIYTTLRFQPLHRVPPYRREARLPVSERLAERGLNLPLHPRLEDRDIDRIVASIAQFGRDHGL